MDNPLRGEVTLTAGDTQYRIRFTTNALCKLEEDLNISVLEIGKKLGAEDVGMKEIRALLAAGLCEDHPAVSDDIKAVGGLIDAAGIKPVAEVISLAFQRAFFGNETSDGGKKKKGRAAKKSH